MANLHSWLNKFSEDINREDGMIIAMIGSFTSFLYKGFLLAGIPFLIYLLIQLN